MPINQRSVDILLRKNSAMEYCIRCLGRELNLTLATEFEELGNILRDLTGKDLVRITRKGTCSTCGESFQTFNAWGGGPVPGGAG